MRSSKSKSNARTKHSFRLVPSPFQHCRNMHILWMIFFTIVCFASTVDPVTSGSTNEKTVDEVAAGASCSIDTTQMPAKSHEKRQSSCNPVIKNPMQPLNDYILKLEQSNPSERPVEIPKDSIQIVPKEDDPIIVTSDDVCGFGHEAVCCRMWWREAYSELTQYTVYECWECTILLVTPYPLYCALIQERRLGRFSCLPGGRTGLVLSRWAASEFPYVKEEKC